MQTAIFSIWVIDFGSQYTPIIERRLREFGFSFITMTLEEAALQLKQNTFPKSFVLSGGPQSVYNMEGNHAEQTLQIIFQSQIPILGICFGIQLLAHFNGGKVTAGHAGEYGQSTIKKIATTSSHPILSLWPMVDNVWMSHGDEITKLPSDFHTLYTNEHNIPVCILHENKPWLGFQFHPEVFHTANGVLYLKSFFSHVANIQPDCEPLNLTQVALKIIQNINIANKDSYILCAFSGGVDSLVAAMLTHKLVGHRLICFFVNHGLVRPQDERHIQLLQQKTPLTIHVLDSKKPFLDALKGIHDPEQKRKIIGTKFIEVFEEQIEIFSKKHSIQFEYLLQGTLYPDVIESHSIQGKHGNGKSATIKSHHNVGGLPERMKLKLLEPLRDFFKDEVRTIGVEIGIDPQYSKRHPFPGPGLGIRIMGEITQEKLDQIRLADEILMDEMRQFDLYDSIWQSLCVLLPVNTVGVKGDGRVYEQVICLRLVNSNDGMTAQWVDVPSAFLRSVSRRITNEVPKITRVVYDITDKPPGTIEWE